MSKLFDLDDFRYCFFKYEKEGCVSFRFAKMYPVYDKSDNRIEGIFRVAICNGLRSCSKDPDDYRYYIDNFRNLSYEVDYSDRCFIEKDGTTVDGSTNCVCVPVNINSDCFVKTIKECINRAYLEDYYDKFLKDVEDNVLDCIKHNQIPEDFNEAKDYVKGLLKFLN